MSEVERRIYGIVFSVLNFKNRCVKHLGFFLNKEQSWFLFCVVAWKCQEAAFFFFFFFKLILPYTAQEHASALFG